MRGLVIKNTGSWYTVKTDDGQLIESKIKGNFRLKGIRSTNPVAVGDYVQLITNQEGTAFISSIEDRQNYIIRVPVIIVFNKCDLLTEEELRYEKMMRTLYETIGYQCVEISAATGEGVDELRPLIRDKKSLLSGNSGVGKSTLINQLIPDAGQRTAEISEAHNSGMHTTTFSEMLELPEGGYLIDTPGIKGFGTFDIEKEELTSYFKEIFKFSQNCKFSDCTHTHEPGCAVIKAVEEHYIAASRYQSYLSMLEDKDENKYREAF